jgi:hypothetical protein
MLGYVGKKERKPSKSRAHCSSVNPSKVEMTAVVFF